MNLTNYELRVIHGALIRAIDFEVESLDAWKDVLGRPLKDPEAITSIATSKRCIAAYKRLSTKVVKMQRPKAKAGK